MPSKRSSLGYRTDIPGFNVRRTSKGITVIELDYWADPRKDETWVEKQKRGAPSLTTFRREMQRDWSSSAGEAFYPEFVARPEFFIRPAPGLLPGVPIIRGWDFGHTHPACVWMQRSPVSGRVWVLREVMPGSFRNEKGNIVTGSFADLVRYLSGQIPFEALLNNPRALQVVNDIKEAHLPEPPWFEGSSIAPLQFLDWAGHEALQHGRHPEDDTKESTDAAILASKGINLCAYYVTPKARGEVIRKLLMPLEDGSPGILFDPACKILCAGFAGGIAYPKPTRENPDPQDPAKDGFHDNLHDALGYPLPQICPLTETGAFAPPPRVVQVGRSFEVEYGGGFDVHETGGGW